MAHQNLRQDGGICCVIVKPLLVDLASNCEKIPITETMRYFPEVHVEHGLQHSKLVKLGGQTAMRSAGRIYEVASIIPPHDFVPRAVCKMSRPSANSACSHAPLIPTEYDTQMANDAANDE